ncbi:MAG: hypothetical protein BGO49_18565 [Planctomycetales bacterium 71-10]|nr:MAG: hypothetical protein BGO49_18565 [Planctomycetales bacterium 71-10]
MPRHVWVNSDRLEKGSAVRNVGGMELTVEVSPYSIPKAVVGRYDDRRGRFVIEFKYIDDEKAAPSPRLSDGVEIREGLYSHKILSISIPIDSPHLESVGVISLRTRIAKALKERLRDVEDPDSPHGPDVLNQEVAEEILSDATLMELVG